MLEIMTKKEASKKLQALSATAIIVKLVVNVNEIHCLLCYALPLKGGSLILFIIFKCDIQRKTN